MLVEQLRAEVAFLRNLVLQLTRQIAEQTGVSVGQAQRDLKGTESPDSVKGKVTGRDGKQHPATKAAPAKPAGTDRPSTVGGTLTATRPGPALIAAAAAEGVSVEALAGSDRPGDMTEVEAHDFVACVRDALGDLPGRTVDAYRRRAWLALGYGSWAALCDREGVRLPREASADLHRGGLSLRAIGAVTGLDHRTVHRDLSARACL